jgi:hypothetical protein
MKKKILIIGRGSIPFESDPTPLFMLNDKYEWLTVDLQNKYQPTFNENMNGEFINNLTYRINNEKIYAFGIDTYTLYGCNYNLNEFKIIYDNLENDGIFFFFYTPVPIHTPENCESDVFYDIGHYIVDRTQLLYFIDNNYDQNSDNFDQLYNKFFEDKYNQHLLILIEKLKLSGFSNIVESDPTNSELFLFNENNKESLELYNITKNNYICSSRLFLAYK